MPRDPYMRDKNIRDAASLQLLAGPALGAGLGGAASGWFGIPAGPAIVIGLVVGYLLASVLVFQYGGRSTR